MQILQQPITREELCELAKSTFGDMIKCDVSDPDARAAIERIVEQFIVG